MRIGIKGDTCNGSNELGDRSLVPTMQFACDHHQEICQEEQLIILKVLDNKCCDPHQIMALVCQPQMSEDDVKRKRKRTKKKITNHCTVIVNLRELDDVEQT